MDIAYKGYTIVPNSERQPDGRWLPVAELSVASRGLVTHQPPLRATPRELRATRAEADAAAVNTAKAWIDAGERERTMPPRAGPPTSNDQARSITADPPRPLPSGSEAAPPRVSRKTRAQDALADAPAAVKGADDRRRPTPFDKIDWASLYQAVGLDSDEQVDRLTRVLVVHFLLDRLVTVALATKLASNSNSIEAPDIANTLSDIALMPLPTRATLASIMGVVAPAVAESIVEVNRLRNRLVQVKPTLGQAGWEVSDADEIASPDASGKCLRRGVEAARQLIAAYPAKES